ncbi:MAG: GNAT family N-acetyltransferase [Acidobacteria bacterium]|nr:GNAT family N-acetyltransferase [Acidobacteriota bacterium]
MVSGERNLDLGEIMVRLVQSDDTPALQALARDSYQQYVAAEGSEPEPMKADYSALISLGSTRLAEYRGTIIGLLVLEAQPNYLLLDNIAVAKSVRGEGVGKLLMAFSESQAAAKGLSEFPLYTGEVMTQNRHYYESLGYVESHRAFESGQQRV